MFCLNDNTEGLVDGLVARHGDDGWDDGEIDLRVAIDAFLAYAGRFADDEVIRRKTTHSMRVAAICHDLAVAWDDDGRGGRGSVEPATPRPPVKRADATVAGLFHDTGRFVQHALYGRYSDFTDKCDHAGLGAEMLGRYGMLSHAVPSLEGGRRDRVLQAIRLHSCWRLPEGIDARTLALSRLLREADVIDLLDLSGEGRLGGIADGLGLPDPRIVASARRRESADRRLVSTPADAAAARLCLAFVVRSEAGRDMAAVHGGWERYLGTLGFADDEAAIAFFRIGDAVRDHLNS